jgi:site-specific recombinase XerD
MDKKQGSSGLFSSSPLQGAEEGAKQINPVVDHAIRTGSFECYQKRKSGHTVRAQKAHLAIFETYLSEVGISFQGFFSNPASWRQITFSIVENFVEWQLRKGYAIKSVNERLSTVKRYAALACKSGVLTTDELFLIREVKGFRRVEGQRIDAQRTVTRVGNKKVATTFLTQDQLDQLFRIPDINTPQGSRDLLALRLLNDLGLRPGEVVSLVVADLDLETGTLCVHRPMTDGKQFLGLSSETLEVAKSYLDLRRDRTPSSPLLVRSRKSGRLEELLSRKDGTLYTPFLSTRSLFERVHTLGEAIGVNINAYDLGHQWVRTSDTINERDP